MCMYIGIYVCVCMAGYTKGVLYTTIHIYTNTCEALIYVCRCVCVDVLPMVAGRGVRGEDLLPWPVPRYLSSVFKQTKAIYKNINTINKEPPPPPASPPSTALQRHHNSRRVYAY